MANLLPSSESIIREIGAFSDAPSSTRQVNRYRAGPCPDEPSNGPDVQTNVVGQNKAGSLACAQTLQGRLQREAHVHRLAVVLAHANKVISRTQPDQCETPFLSKARTNQVREDAVREVTSMIA